MSVVDEKAKDILFREARTYNAWQEKDISDELLHDLWELVKFGPTSANCLPMRIKFVKSQEAKEKLKPLMDEGNVEKTMSAPVVAIIAYDLKFYEHLPRLFPHTNAKSWFEGQDAKIKDAAQRNGTLQGGYLIMAARALGLDCGPMSGFDGLKVKDAFFADEDVVVNFICNLGYGSEKNLFARSPRFDFDDVCEIV
jgi:3-hydroxypropanoate dehydrogenase